MINSDTHHSLRGAFVFLRQEQSAISMWITGYVVTPAGIVAVFSRDKYTSLRFVHRRKIHDRTFHQGFQSQELRRLAMRMVREITHRR